MSASPSPIEEIKRHLTAAWVPVPDDGTLEALLAIAPGEPGRAASLIVDDYRASNPSAPRPRPGHATAGLSDSSGLRRRHNMEQLQVAENEAEYEAAVSGSTRRANERRQSGYSAADRFREGGVLSLLYDTIAFPFWATRALVGFLARILRFPALFNGGGTGSPGGFRESGRPAAAKEFLDDLLAASEGSGHLDSDQPSSSTFTPPPHILTGSYSAALKQAKEDLSMLVVVLQSSKKDEQDQALLRLLSQKEVSDTLSSPQYLLWGACVERKEGHQVSRQLSARSLPFIGCVALRPSVRMGVAATSPRGSSPRLALVSRTTGPAVSTSAEFVSHLQDSYSLVSSYLDGLQAEKIARETERRLMAEQDRAYEEASRRDAERVNQRRAEAKRTQDAEELRRLEEKSREDRLKQKVLWRRWARHHLVPSEEPPAGSPATTSIIASLPNGARISRTFFIESPIEQVYAWIESSSIAQCTPEELAEITKPEGYDHAYDFSVFFGYPRKRLGAESLGQGLLIKDFEGLFPRVNLIVEGVVEGATSGAEEISSSSSSSSDEDDD